MDLTLDIPGDHHFVRSMDERGIRIGDEYYVSSLLVSAERIDEAWPPATTVELEAPHLDAIFGFEPELVLLGTGQTQEFLPPPTMMAFYERGIGVEVMTTAAACRTFNILVTEGRNVVAALMQDYSR